MDVRGKSRLISQSHLLKRSHSCKVPCVVSSKKALEEAKGKLLSSVVQEIDSLSSLSLTKIPSVIYFRSVGRMW